MTIRSASLLTVLAISAVILAGCTPTPTPTSAPSESSSPSETPSPDPTQEQQIDLPDNALLGFTAHATADNGAELDIEMVVLKAEPWDSPLGEPRSSATTEWCAGELDESVYQMDSGWSFVEVDVTATLADGSDPWPTDLPMQVFPLPGGPSITAAGDVHQVEAPDPSGEDDPGYYVPHCLQNAFLDGPGSGKTYLGFANDATTWGAWATSYYGVTFDGFGEPIDPSRVDLTDCATVITTTGEQYGGTPDVMTDHFFSTFCQVGGAS